MREIVSCFRSFFAYAALFSLAINVLLLVPPLYMLQVFDRVLTSRSGEALAVLTFAAVVDTKDCFFLQPTITVRLQLAASFRSNVRRLRITFSATSICPANQRCA